MFNAICYTKIWYFSKSLAEAFKSHLYKITFSQFDLFFLQETVGEQQAGPVWNSNGPGRAEPTL